MSGKSDGSDALSDGKNAVKKGVKNDANVAGLSILNVIYQTSMKFLKDGVALKIFVL